VNNNTSLLKNIPSWFTFSNKKNYPIIEKIEDFTFGENAQVILGNDLKGDSFLWSTRAITQIMIGQETEPYSVTIPTKCGVETGS
jgi:hypothetical protein